VCLRPLALAFRDECATAFGIQANNQPINGWLIGLCEYHGNEENSPSSRNHLFCFVVLTYTPRAVKTFLRFLGWAAMPCVVFVSIVGCSGGSGSSVPATPTPSISSVSPGSVQANQAAPFLVTITGSGFISSSQVQVNGTNVPTTYVSPTQLQAQIPAALASSGGQLVITVANGSLTSGVLVSQCHHGYESGSGDRFTEPRLRRSERKPRHSYGYRKRFRPNDHAECKCHVAFCDLRQQHAIDSGFNFD